MRIATLAALALLAPGVHAQTPVPSAAQAPAAQAPAAQAPAAQAPAAQAPAAQAPATQTPVAQPEPVHLPKRFDLSQPEIRAFIKAVAQRDHLSRRRVRRLLARAQPLPQIIDAMNRPAERVLQWWEYRRLFLTEQRIEQGVEFWQAHRSTLERVAAEQGVPPEYLVAILGCETFYGRITGRDRVLDALMTLAFFYPPRADYFRGELEQFLLLVREEHIDPLKVKGSYSGAMGAPQFMPSAYRRYAVDEGHDHRRDLWSDWGDVLASIANYLRQNGWQPGQPVIADARLDPDPTFTLDDHGLDLDTTLARLNAEGVRVGLDLPGETPAILVSAEQQDGPSYRVGFQNFYVITRYNHSARYAMAVNDLAASIAARVHAAALAAAPAS